MIARTWSADAADGGDVAAPRMDEFARALTAQLPALRRYAAVLIGNRTAADDLVQDCIEKALRQSGKLDQPERIGAWLRAILHNLYIDEMRRRSRQGLTVDLTDLENAAHGATPDPVAAMDMDRALARLSVEHRQILLLVGLEGLNYREVADELSMPLGTVMSRLARAREKLRETMELKPAEHKAS
jgi:RNA polymerase sigma-70 factor (ECF subfamily)